MNLPSELSKAGKNRNKWTMRSGFLKKPAAHVVLKNLKHGKMKKLIGNWLWELLIGPL